MRLFWEDTKIALPAAWITVMVLNQLGCTATVLYLAGLFQTARIFSRLEKERTNAAQ